MISSIIIARSSADRHEVSCQAQVRDIREKALSMGEHIHKVLEFSKTTYSEFLDDPEFQNLLAEVKSKTRKWSKIWFYDTARVSRDRAKAQTVKRFLQNHNVDVEFLNFHKSGIEHLDNVMEGILEAFDQMHSDYSRAGAIRGQKQNILNGYRAGGKAPYGYILKKHPIGFNRDNEPIHRSTLLPDPDTFDVAKEYLERRAIGESRRSIMNDFENRGIKSPSGNNHWNDTSGKSIEENILTYQGHLTYNRHNSRIGKKKYKGGTKWKNVKEWVINKNTHKRCIDDDIAYKINIQLKNNKKSRNNPGPKRYLLTDILYCGDCSSRMVGKSGFYSCLNKLRNSKACSNGNIKADLLDREVLKHLKEHLIKKEFYQEFITTIKAQYEKYKQQSLKNQKKYLKRAKELDKQISKLMTLFSRDKIPVELVEKQIEPLHQEKKDLDTKIIDISQINEALDIKMDEYSTESIKSNLERFEELLSDDNMIEMRGLVRDFIHRITLGPKDNPKAKQKWLRPVHLESYVRALTMIKMASPRGFEPLLPA